jgi:hypothetical protein
MNLRRPATLASIAALAALLAATLPASADMDPLNFDIAVEGPTLAVGFDHPFCDNNVNAGEDIPVFAGCETHVEGQYYSENPGGQAGIVGVGIVASITNPDQVDHIEWKVTPDPNNGCQLPKLIDQLSPDEPVSAISPVTTTIDAGYSAVVIDYTYQGADGKPTAKVGDKFTVTATIFLNGSTDTKEGSVQFHITPGAKALHVSIDPTINGREAAFVADIAQYQSWTEQQFIDAFKDYRILTPVGSKQQKEFVVYCFDRFRNPIEAGEIVDWRLNGGGMLGEPGELNDHNDGTLPGDNSKIYKTDVGANGRTSINFTQIFYPNCPFSPEFEESTLTSAVEIMLDSAFVEAGTSVVSTEELPQIAKIGGILVRSVYSSWTDPRLDLREERALTVEVVLKVGDSETPVANVPVTCTSTNGKLAEAMGVANTDNQGRATFHLTSVGALVAEVECIASFNGKSALLTPPGAAWNAGPGQPFMTVDREIIAGNRVTDGSICIEVLEDAGEALIPNAGPEGDGMLCVPVYHESHVTLHGLPGHEYTVTAITSAMLTGASSLYSAYSFENLALENTTIDGISYSQISSSEDGLYQAHLNGSVLTTAENDVPPLSKLIPDKLASLVFNTGPGLPIPGNYCTTNTDQLATFNDPAAMAFFTGADTEMRFYFKPSVEDPGIEKIAFKGDNLNLKYQKIADGSGRFILEFKTNQGNRSVSTDPITGLGSSWTRVSVLTRANGIVLEATKVMSPFSLPQGTNAIRDSEGYLDGDADGKSYFYLGGEALLDQQMPVSIQSWQQNHFDRTEFRKYDTGNSSVFLVGLTARGTIVIGPEGVAIVTVRSNGSHPDKQQDAEVILIKATGSKSFSLKVFSTADWFNARLIACGKAFLNGTEGLGKGGSWYVKAAAWASEVIPFASDIRTLSFEIYKAATGCDKVSGPNVTFAVIGLVVDVATLGSGKVITGPMKVGFVAAKELLKSMAISIAINSTAEFALNGYMKLMTQEASRDPASKATWLTHSEKFLQEVKNISTHVSNELKDTFYGAMSSVNDVIDMAEIHASLGDKMKDLYLEIAAP